MTDDAMAAGVFCTLAICMALLGVAAKREGTCAKWWYPLASLFALVAVLALFYGCSKLIAAALTWAGVFQ